MSRSSDSSKSGDSSVNPTATLRASNVLAARGFSSCASPSQCPSLPPYSEQKSPSSRPFQPCRMPVQRGELGSGNDSGNSDRLDRIVDHTINAWPRCKALYISPTVPNFLLNSDSTAEHQNHRHDAVAHRILWPHYHQPRPPHHNVHGTIIMRHRND